MKHKHLQRMGAWTLAAMLLLSLFSTAFAADGVKVTLDKTELQLSLDGFDTLAATVDGGAEGSKVTWSSDNATVATVDESGKVTAVSAGTATITAAYTPAEGGTDGQPTATCAVTVSAPVVSFPSALPTLAVGDSTPLNAVVTNPVSGGVLSYAVEALSSSIVRVEGDQVIGVKAGTGKVKAIYTYTIGEQKHTVVAESEDIFVRALSILVTPTPLSIEVGDTRSLKLTSNSINRGAVWVSNNPAAVTVDSTGKVTAVAPGVAHVTATVNGVSSSPVVVTVSGITISQSTMDLFVGKTGQLSCSTYGFAANETVLWTSSNVSVASVKNGKVAAYNTGTAIITATAGVYSVSCTVTVTEDMADDIPGNVNLGQVLPFDGKLIEDLKKAAADQISESLVYVSGLSVSPSQGVLYYTYASADAPGSGVGSGESFYIGNVTGQKKLAQVTFVPAPDFTGTAVISYTGYGATSSFMGKIRITVESSGDVAYNTPAGKGLLLVADDFSAVCNKKTDRALRYVMFGLPSAEKGTLYYNYSELEPYSLRVDETTKYYLTGGGMQLSRITFLPSESYTGVVTIPYYGTDVAGETYNGAIVITVYAGDLTGTGNIAYQTVEGYGVDLLPIDFNAACVEKLGSTLNYVYLGQPDPSQGTLYYNLNSATNYGAVVSETTRYFYQMNATPNLSKVSFMPAKEFSGVVTIPYVGYASNGKRFEGTVTIRVSASVGAVAYNTTMGRSVAFNGLDFNELCQAINGVGLRSVSFTLPSYTEGVLYYHYRIGSNLNTRVTASSSYSVAALSNITFVPRSGFSGIVSIPFSGYDSENNRINGTVEINVEPYYADDVISYKALSGGMAYFNAEDFNDVSLLLTGDDLDYVTLSSPSTGSIFYRNSATYSYTFYRRASSSTTRTLDNVSYQARMNHTGIATIRYTGMSVGGVSFSGTVEILISAPVADVVNYHGGSLPIRFDPTDFEEACDRVMPQTLSYIELETLPAASAGKLLLNYTLPNTGTAVRAGTRYYTSRAPYLNQIYFIAKEGFQGTVTLSYTAVDNRGNRVEGQLKIHISDSNVVRHFTDLKNYSWAVPSIEYVYNSGIMDGVGSGQFKPTQTVDRATFMGTICRALDFTARKGTGFTDVPEDHPYYTEIMTAQAMGIAQGYNGKFRPDEVITREEAIVTLVRAMKAAKMNLTTGEVMLLDAYGDRTLVSNYAASDMATMIKMGVIKGDENGNLNPQTLITRSEMAILIHRVLTL